MSDDRRDRVGAADGPTVSVPAEARRSQVLVAMLDELGIARERRTRRAHRRTELARVGEQSGVAPSGRQAAANAREKAAAYAAGVDSHLGPLLALAEPEDGRFGPRLTPMSRRAGVGADMPVETGDQEVTAMILATFALLPVS